MIKVFILEINQYDQMLIVVNRGDEKEAKSQIKTNQFLELTIILPQQIYIALRLDRA